MYTMPMKPAYNRGMGDNLRSFNQLQEVSDNE